MNCLISIITPIYEVTEGLNVIIDFLGLLNKMRSDK